MEIFKKGGKVSKLLKFSEECYDKKVDFVVDMFLREDPEDVLKREGPFIGIQLAKSVAKKIAYKYQELQKTTSEAEE